MTVMGDRSYSTDELLGLADCDARAGEPLGKALRWAAVEVARLTAERDMLSAALTRMTIRLGEEVGGTLATEDGLQAGS